MKKVELSESALLIIQEALAVLREVYDSSQNDKLYALEEVAQSIEDQTGIVSPGNTIPSQPVAPY